MATLYIAEFDKLGIDGRGHDVMSPAQPPIAEQTVAIGMTSTASSTFSTSTLFVQLHCDAICSVAFGVAPVAASTNQRMAANETRFMAVRKGDKAAVITNS